MDKVMKALHKYSITLKGLSDIGTVLIGYHDGIVSADVALTTIRDRYLRIVKETNAAS